MYFLLHCVGFLSIFNLFAMESNNKRPIVSSMELIPATKKYKKEEESESNSFFRVIPTEIRLKIITHALADATIHHSLATIKSLMSVNHAFKDCIADYHNSQSFIEYLENKYTCEFIDLKGIIPFGQNNRADQKKFYDVAAQGNTKALKILFQKGFSVFKGKNLRYLFKVSQWALDNNLFKFVMKHGNVTDEQIYDYGFDMYFEVIKKDFREENEATIKALTLRKNAFLTELATVLKFSDVYFQDAIKYHNVPLVELFIKNKTSRNEERIDHEDFMDIGAEVPSDSADFTLLNYAKACVDYAQSAEDKKSAQAIVNLLTSHGWQ